MLNTALGILAGLLYLAQRYYKKREADRAQKESDRIKDNPTGWFRDHFSVSDDTSDGGKTKTSDTKAGRGDGS